MDIFRRFTERKEALVHAKRVLEGCRDIMSFTDVVGGKEKRKLSETLEQISVSSFQLVALAHDAFLIRRLKEEEIKPLGKAIADAVMHFADIGEAESSVKILYDFTRWPEGDSGLGLSICGCTTPYEWFRDWTKAVFANAKSPFRFEFFKEGGFLSDSPECQKAIVDGIIDRFDLFKDERLFDLRWGVDTPNFLRFWKRATPEQTERLFQRLKESEAVLFPEKIRTAHGFDLLMACAKKEGVSPEIRDSIGQWIEATLFDPAYGDVLDNAAGRLRAYAFVEKYRDERGEEKPKGLVEAKLEMVPALVRIGEAGEAFKILAREVGAAGARGMVWKDFAGLEGQKAIVNVAVEEKETKILVVKADDLRWDAAYVQGEILRPEAAEELAAKGVEPPQKRFEEVWNALPDYPEALCRARVRVAPKV